MKWQTLSCGSRRMFPAIFMSIQPASIAMLAVRLRPKRLLRMAITRSFTISRKQMTQSDE